MFRLNFWRCNTPNLFDRNLSQFVVHLNVCEWACVLANMHMNKLLLLIRYHFIMMRQKCRATFPIVQNVFCSPKFILSMFEYVSMRHPITMNEHTRFATKSSICCHTWDGCLWFHSLSPLPPHATDDFVLTLTDKRIFIYLFVCLFLLHSKWTKSYALSGLMAHAFVCVANTWSQLYCFAVMKSSTQTQQIHGHIQTHMLRPHFIIKYISWAHA